MRPQSKQMKNMDLTPPGQSQVYHPGPHGHVLHDIPGSFLALHTHMEGGAMGLGLVLSTIVLWNKGCCSGFLTEELRKEQRRIREKKVLLRP